MEQSPEKHGAEKQRGASLPPRWDLSALFSSPDAPDIAQGLDDIAARARDFEKTYGGRVEKLAPADFATAIVAYEKIAEASARIETYAELTAAADSAMAGKAADMREKLNAACAPLLFFTLEINKMDEAALLEKMTAPQAARYAPWIAGLRAERGHQLGAAVERYLQEMDAVTQPAWRRLYDQTLRDMRFTVRGKKLTEAQVVSLFDTSQDMKLRHAAFAEYGAQLGAQKNVFALIANTLAELHAQDDRRRAFVAPDSFRHVENRIAPEEVKTLIETVKAGYAATAHRYYAWKAKKFGQARLHAADRNAPLPGQRPRRYTWDEAREIVLSSFAKLSPEMEKIGRRFFDEGWIDALPRAGKDSGGFSHAAVPDVHPYILINFFGTAADVQTLAHELGHGIHQVLAAKQGFLNAQTPLTLAETASVFGEMLTFRALLEAETDALARRNLIASKVEDMLNTVVRQTAFFIFEQRLHGERREKGELSADRIGEIWLQTQRESLGAAVNLDVKGAENMWAGVPHFVHTPFYVYAYAFGDTLVNALYDAYDAAADKKEFADKYTAMLEAGGTKRHETALAPFGFDTGDAQFWKKGLGVISRYIDDIERLDKLIALEKEIAENREDVAPAPKNAAPPQTLEKPRKDKGGFAP